MKCCYSCKRQLEDHVKFCSGCGSKQEILSAIVTEKPISEKTLATSQLDREVSEANNITIDEAITFPQKQAKFLKPLFVVGIVLITSVVWWLVSKNTSTTVINNYQVPESKISKQSTPKPQSKIEPPISIEVLESNATNLNQEINQIITAREAWFKEKNFSFPSKAPITTKEITNAHLSDSTYPTPIEAKEMKEWIDFRQQGYKKIEKVTLQYEPLSSLMKSSLALNKEMANKYAASTYELVNGKLTYGEFNRIRKNDGIWYEQSRQALEKTQRPVTKQEIMKNSKEVIF